MSWHALLILLSKFAGWLQAFLGEFCCDNNIFDIFLRLFCKEDPDLRLFDEYVQDVTRYRERDVISRQELRMVLSNQEAEEVQCKPLRLEYPSEDLMSANLSSAPWTAESTDSDVVTESPLTGLPKLWLRAGA